MAELTRKDAAVAETALLRFFITKEQYDAATGDFNSSGGKLSFGEILVKKGVITSSQLPILEQLASESLKKPEFSSRGDKLFGNLVLEYRLASDADVASAAEEQKRLEQSGKKLRLGQILIMRGSITAAQVKNLIELQKKKTIICPSCKSQVNVSGMTPGEAAKCPSCGTVLVPAPLLAAIGDGTPGIFTPEPVTPSLKSQNRMGRISNPVLGQNLPELKAGDEFGNFQIIEKIARGGMGVIYKAKQMGLDRVIALKTLAAGKTATAKQLAFFYHEAQAVAKLKHPNIVLVFDVGQVSGEHFISMEFILGESLSRLIAAGTLDPLRAARIARDAAAALSYANLNGVLHRDVKPGNIMIEKNTARVLITDFGIATFRSSELDGKDKSASAVGTPPYMAPEQADPTGALGAVDAQSDLYSLGVVLYEMLAGVPPWRGASSIELVNKMLHESPKKPSEIRPEIPEQLENICLKAIAREKKNRYAAWEEFTYDLDDFINRKPESPVAEPEKKPLNIGKIGIIAAAVAAAAAALIIIFFVL
jgi:predicted Ser/Thr protein kinase